VSTKDWRLLWATGCGLGLGCTTTAKLFWEHVGKDLVFHEDYKLTTQVRAALSPAKRTSTGRVLILAVGAVCRGW
jgi:hypothetical protein